MDFSPTTPATCDRDQIIVLNRTTSPLLRLPPELRIKVYDFAFSTATLRPRGPYPYSYSVKCSVEEWKRCLRLENASKGLTETCRQLRQETADNFQQNLETLVLPFYVDLAVLVHVLGRRKRASVETIEIHEKLAKRLRGLMFGHYLGHRVDLWKDGKLAGRVFRSLKCVVVKGVWEKNVQKTKTAIKSCFGKEELLIKFS